MQNLLAIDNTLAAVNSPADLAKSAESLFIIICLLGSGDETDRARSLLAAKIWLESVSLVTTEAQSETVIASQTTLEGACAQLDSLVHADLPPPIQDGRQPQVSDVVDSIIGILLDAMLRGAISTGMWACDLPGA